MAIKTPISDPDSRIAALREYDIMDTSPEKDFDDLSLLTSFICGTPIALITLLDNQRQWFKSSVGLSSKETPIEQAFCAHAVQRPEVFLVPDATQDARFSNNPLVTGDPHIRFYAGAPLITPGGVALGTICAIDRIPRDLSKEQQEALAALSRAVIRTLELRKTAKALRDALQEKIRAEKEIATLQGLLPMCSWCRKVRDDESFWHNVDDYLAHHSELRFSHGVCPDCAARVRQEMGLKARPNSQ